jgi:hypothetical protein
MGLWFVVVGVSGVGAVILWLLRYHQSLICIEWSCNMAMVFRVAGIQGFENSRDSICFAWIVYNKFL